MATLGVTNLHLNRAEADGNSFVGLDGCVRYKRRGRDILYTQAAPSSCPDSCTTRHTLPTPVPGGRKVR